MGKGQAPPRHQGKQLQILMSEDVWPALPKPEKLLGPCGISFFQDSMLEMAGQVIIPT